MILTRGLKVIELLKICKINSALSINGAPIPATPLKFPEYLIKTRSILCKPQHKIQMPYRVFSTLQNDSVHSTTELVDESRDFDAVLPDVLNDVTQSIEDSVCPEAVDWIIRSLQYNVPNSKKRRGLLTVLTYKYFLKGQQFTTEDRKLVQYLGWCVEMLYSFFMMTDDIMDKGIMRHDKPCWYRLNDVGLTAVNDAFMIQEAIFIIIRKYFSHMECFADLMVLFHKVILRTSCGQVMDLVHSKKPVSTFTMENYKLIVTNKSSYSVFYLPVALGMYLSGMKNTEAFQKSKQILLEQGHLYQMQDDSLDCYGGTYISGRVGTDIQENKCTWLSVAFMQRANKKQKSVMTECYGNSDPTRVERVQELYKEIGLSEVYRKLEEEVHNKLEVQIGALTSEAPQQIMLDINKKFYRREF